MPTRKELLKRFEENRRQEETFNVFVGVLLAVIGLYYSTAAAWIAVGVVSLSFKVGSYCTQRIELIVIMATTEEREDEGVALN